MGTDLTGDKKKAKSPRREREKWLNKTRAPGRVPAAPCGWTTFRKRLR